jgi:RNA polymerase sigma factor (sigma-70 family)
MKIIEDQIPSLIREGKDREVLSFLYKEVFPQVKKYIVRHNGNREDAYDVFQDAIVYFYKQVMQNELNPNYKVFGYLYRLSLNRWINKLKKDKRYVLSEDMQEFDNEESLPRLELINGPNENLLVSLFSGIGDKCVELLTYTIYYNLLMEDIMLRMGFTSVNAVKMRHMRCKEKLVLELQNNPSLLGKIKGI